MLITISIIVYVVTKKAKGEQSRASVLDQIDD